MKKRNYITIEQATAMIPTLEKVFNRLQQMQMQIRIIHKRLKQVGMWPKALYDEIIISESDQQTFHDFINLKLLADGLNQEVELLKKQGCLVKDIELGLVDWYSYYNDKEVLLCWKLGEKSVAYWHEVDTGFQDRKLIRATNADIDKIIAS